MSQRQLGQDSGANIAMAMLGPILAPIMVLFYPFMRGGRIAGTAIFAAFFLFWARDAYNGNPSFFFQLGANLTFASWDAWGYVVSLIIGVVAWIVTTLLCKVNSFLWFFPALCSVLYLDLVIGRWLGMSVAEMTFEFNLYTLALALIPVVGIAVYAYFEPFSD